MDPAAGEVTALLRAWHAGDEGAYRRVSALLYEELRRRAAFTMRGERLRTAIDRCLEKDPDRRYQRASDLRAELESIERQLAAPDVSAPRRSRLALGAAAIVIAGSIGATLWVRNASFRESAVGAGAAQIRSLAVPPLDNASGNPDEAYFVDGMHDALITDLARIGVPRVIARPSMEAFKGSKEPLREIAAKLGVDGLVTGSVMRANDRVRITAQLVKASTGEVVWANRYERSAGDILVLQNEVVGAIAQGIHATLSPEQSARLAATRSVNPAAHDAYRLRSASADISTARVVARITPACARASAPSTITWATRAAPTRCTTRSPRRSTDRSAACRS